MKVNFKHILKVLVCIAEGHVGVGVKYHCPNREVFTCERCGKFLASRRFGGIDYVRALGSSERKDLNGLPYISKLK
jgi:hypothetical protein